MNIPGPTPTLEAHIDRILRSLPQWFGIEASLQEYLADSRRFHTFLAEAPEPIGFLTSRQHFPGSWQVHCVALHAAHRGQGVVHHMRRAVERWLLGQSAQVLQVKRLAAEHPSPEYAETRRFYEAMGYAPLEVSPTLRGPRLPVLQLVKRLSES
ncbi:MAG: GNAT family N-acetyltransferase [Rubrivivax sp.]|jgi:hypothetical protein